ncbi:MAG: type I phosphomannose isomerase catalytic subunit [Bacilli bacterium]|nr:type I phosphomannose isomerase catalytic subunit [Bacilli bacterium]
MGHVLKMKPVFKEMIWGGHKLRDVYGYDIPSDNTGECWAISAHHNGDCEIAEGEFAGKTLSWVFENHRELFGNIEGNQFPLLVKIIDAKNDLSVQVHPNDEYAGIHENSLGKTECWYVLQADEGTKMVMGHHAQTKEEFVKAIEDDDYDNLLNSFTINKGDFFYIPSGTLHAICSGSLIYEAQQSSDITYRVYDYHRKDKDGNERQLHVQQSIDVTNVPADISNNKLFVNSHLDHGTKTRYVDSEFFKVDCYKLKAGENIIKNDTPFQLVSIINGEGMMDDMEVKMGDHFVICSDKEETIFDGNMEVMITTL